MIASGYACTNRSSRGFIPVRRCALKSLSLLGRISNNYMIVINGREICSTIDRPKKDGFAYFCLSRAPISTMSSTGNFSDSRSRETRRILARSRLIFGARMAIRACLSRGQSLRLIEFSFERKTYYVIIIDLSTYTRACTEYFMDNRSTLPPEISDKVR